MKASYSITATELSEAERGEWPQVVAQRAYVEELARAHDKYRFTLESDANAAECEEAALKAALYALQRHYELHAERWRKRLVDLYARYPKPIVIPPYILDPKP